MPPFPLRLFELCRTSPFSLSVFPSLYRALWEDWPLFLPPDSSSIPASLPTFCVFSRPFPVAEKCPEVNECV